ncbi:MAG TPA: histidine kinase [Burkholderiaceae bacterium]|nr:histidine kinase [Burkholderiaceae bacterium]
MFSISDSLTRFSPTPAPGEAPLRWIGWHLIQGLVGNTVIAVLITVLMPKAGYFDHFGHNLVYSHCIGFAIRVLMMAAMYFDLQGGRPPVPWRMVLVVVVSTVLGLLIGAWLAAWLLDMPPFFLDPRLRGALTIPILAITTIASLASTAYFWTREHLASLQARADAEHARAEHAAREAELRMLRAQLEPHMLFNTLANLRVLITVDTEAAQTMLDRLIAFLRATLTASRRDRVPLRDEFTLIGDYLELIAVRLGSRLSFDLKLPPELADIPVLPMLLQPLVENAIKHGIEPALDGGHVRVTARQEDEAVVIDVVDTGVGVEPASTPAGGDAGDGGFGLHQIRERLRTAYGEAASLEIGRTVPPAGDDGAADGVPAGSRGSAGHEARSASATVAARRETSRGPEAATARGTTVTLRLPMEKL